MRKTGLLAILGILLFSAGLFAEEPNNEVPVLPEQPAVVTDAPSGDALESEALSSPTMSVDGSAMTADARDWNTEPEWAGLIRPTPPPNYCPDCQPCTATIQCGLDPHNGSSLGVCSPPPNSYCPGTTVSVCICY